jgi:hypothetical protein
MAAVIQLRTGQALVEHGTDLPRPARATGPQLEVIHGGRSSASRRLRRTYLARRVAVLAGALVVAWLLVQLVGAAFAPLGGSDAAQVAPPSAVHVVASGDTLWGLAESIDPQADPRDVVDQIVQMNEVGTPGAPLGPDLQLRVGGELRLPVDS